MNWNKGIHYIKVMIFSQAHFSPFFHLRCLVQLKDLIAMFNMEKPLHPLGGEFPLHLQHLQGVFCLPKVSTFRVSWGLYSTFPWFVLCFSWMLVSLGFDWHPYCLISFRILSNTLYLQTICQQISQYKYLLKIKYYRYPIEYANPVINPDF